jgi:hypothetical protein
MIKRAFNTFADESGHVGERSVFPGKLRSRHLGSLAPFFRLPGDITRGKDCVTVKLRPFPDRQMNRDLTEVCLRIEAARLCLPDGLRLRFQVGRLT